MTMLLSHTDDCLQHKKYVSSDGILTIEGIEINAREHERFMKKSVYVPACKWDSRPCSQSLESHNQLCKKTLAKVADSKPS